MSNFISRKKAGKVLKTADSLRHPFFICLKNGKNAQKRGAHFGGRVQGKKAAPACRKARGSGILSCQALHWSKKARMLSASAAARPWIISGLPPPRPWIPALIARLFARRSVLRLPMM